MATITDQITVTRHPDGRISVEARAPRPLYADKTYNCVVFDGVWGNGFAIVTWWHNDERNKLPIVEVCAETAEAYLTGLATLTLAANGVTA